VSTGSRAYDDASRWAWTRNEADILEVRAGSLSVMRDAVAGTPRRNGMDERAGPGAALRPTNVPHAARAMGRYRGRSAMWRGLSMNVTRRRAPEPWDGWPGSVRRGSSRARHSAMKHRREYGSPTPLVAASTRHRELRHALRIPRGAALNRIGTPPPGAARRHRSGGESLAVSPQSASLWRAQNSVSTFLVGRQRHRLLRQRSRRRVSYRRRPRVI